MASKNVLKNFWITMGQLTFVNMYRATVISNSYLYFFEFNSQCSPLIRFNWKQKEGSFHNKIKEN